MQSISKSGFQAINVQRSAQIHYGTDSFTIRERD